LKYLLDTHVMLWLFADTKRIKKNVRETLADPAHAVYVSAASTWEITIKAGLRKLQLPNDLAPGEYLRRSIARAGLSMLDISSEHTYAVFSLPPIHQDPFDRLLIAQATVEDLTLVTADPKFKEYNVSKLTL
jgi:PIN domain nuclease of toxin-antitoxin system